MNEQEIIDRNKLIAEFMGYEFEDRQLSQLKYRYSWENLMPVVEKIMSIKHETKSVHEAFMSIINQHQTKLSQIPITANIETVWKVVVGFCKWYNSQNNKP